MFYVSISHTGAAFEDDKGAEIARILRKIADKVESDNSDNEGPAVDINGHTVGGWTLDDDE